MNFEKEYDLDEIDPRTASEIEMELVARSNMSERAWRRKGDDR